MQLVHIRKECVMEIVLDAQEICALKVCWYQKSDEDKWRLAGTAPVAARKEELAMSAFPEVLEAPQVALSVYCLFFCTFTRDTAELFSLQLDQKPRTFIS